MKKRYVNNNYKKISYAQNKSILFIKNIIVGDCSSYFNNNTGIVHINFENGLKVKVDRFGNIK